MPVLSLLAVVVAAAYIALTGALLPPVVASHFAAGGAANGFMARGSYLAFMLAVVVVLPALLVATGALVRRLPASRISLPNRDYWLAPQRKAATARMLSRLASFPALAVTALLCVVHALVVRANQVQPPRLEEIPFLIALAAFGLAVAGWLVVVFKRFARVP